LESTTVQTLIRYWPSGTYFARFKVFSPAAWLIGLKLFIGTLPNESEIKDKGDVTPAGEKFREILQELSGTRSLHHQCQSGD